MTLTTTQRALDRNQSHEILNHWPVGFAPPGGELLLRRLTRVVLAEAGRAQNPASTLAQASPQSRAWRLRGHPTLGTCGSEIPLYRRENRGSKGCTPCLRNSSQFIATSSAAQAKRLPGIWASLLFAQMLDQVL